MISQSSLAIAVKLDHDGKTIAMSPKALEDGLVVLGNNYYAKDAEGTFIPPFKSIPRLYRESSMKRYWDKAEKNLKADLPPHVHQLADTSFRNMMRKIEASIEDPAAVHANQAILVSGESEAAKTATTKFVMKYLAALSQLCSSRARQACPFESGGKASCRRRKNQKLGITSSFRSHNELHRFNPVLKQLQ